MWWLSAMNGNRNDLSGRVLAYEALHGAGGAVVYVDPTPTGMGDKEYDEDDVETYTGDRNVLDADGDEQTEESEEKKSRPTVALNYGSLLKQKVRSIQMLHQNQ